MWGNSETNEFDEFGLNLKMRFLSYDYEVLLSSWSRIQNKKNNLFLAVRLRLDLPHPLHNDSLQVCMCTLEVPIITRFVTCHRGTGNDGGGW